VPLRIDESLTFNGNFLLAKKAANMGKMKFGKIEIDPAKNPAVLDTATWDPNSAWEMVRSLDETYLGLVQKAITQMSSLTAHEHCTPYAGSYSRYRGSDFCLFSLADGQQVFIEIGADGDDSILGTPIGKKSLEGGKYIAVYRTDAATIHRYFRSINADKGPKALGATARLGIGTRMSTAVWPGIWQAMHKCDFSANAIQNSLRELNVLADILAGRPAQANYLFGFGTIEEGHTGSTFEGLWVAGVLEALKTETQPRYGADADHIMVKRGAGGINRAKRVIDAARYYTFYTLDVGDILDYGAMRVGSKSTAGAHLAYDVWQPAQRKAVLAYHSQKRCVGGQHYQPDEASIGRLVGKYWSALGAVEQLYEHIRSLKSDSAFDLELSIDENPPEVSTFECLTTQTELMFLLLEAQRRQIPLTHVAPNFGIEKAVDYRCPDGLVGLEKRIGMLHHIAGEFGIMLDCHSGDDLSSATRKVIGRATKGQIHFKISPALQLLFAEVLREVEPERFRFWWDDTLAYARREATGGSAIAADCIYRYETSGRAVPSPDHAVFQHYSFASVGRRDLNGQFINREHFYDLSAHFYDEYRDRVERYLCDVADDVFDRGS